MHLQIDYQATWDLVRRQLASLFAYHPPEDDPALEPAFKEAIHRCEKCFAAIRTKYFQRDGRPYFNPFHTGQYSIFLYYLANSVWRLNPGHTSLADRIYYLNKALNGLDIYYEVELPEIFYLDHAVGSVLGRGKYGNYFHFFQNCTVGNNKGIYPRFGEYVCLMAGARVLGDSTIGDYVIFSANCYVKDQDIPSQSLVFGASPQLIIKQKDREYFRERLQLWFFIPA
jgi:serine O-acetyltransferase